MPGRLGTTGAESVPGKGSSAIPAVCLDRSREEGVDTSGKHEALRGTRGRGFRGRVDAGLRRFAASPVPRLTGTRDPSLLRSAMWCKEGRLKNEADCHDCVAGAWKKGF